MARNRFGSQHSSQGSVSSHSGYGSFDQFSSASGYEEPVSLKRGIDTAAEFLDDIKRARVTPNYTSDLAARLSTIEQLVGISSYTGAANSGYGYQHSAPEYGSSRQLPPFRSQQELLDADQFFSQLSSTLPSSKPDFFSPTKETPTSGYTLPSNGFPSLHARKNSNISSHRNTSPSVNVYPTLSSSPVGAGNGYESAAAPQLASRYDYDNGRRFSVGVLQKSSKCSAEAEQDDLSTAMSQLSVNSKPSTAELNQVERHAEVIKKMRELIAQMLEEYKEPSKKASPEKSSLYPTISAF